MLNITQRLSIAQKLNDASRALYLPALIGVVTIIMMVLWYMAYTDHTLKWMRIARAWYVYLPFAGLLLLATWWNSMAWENYLDVRKLLKGTPTPPPRNLGMSNFEDTARAGGTRLVARIDNQLLLSRFQFEPSDWRLLIRHLRPNYPKWQRAALDNAKLFTNITAPGEFNRISREFERMQIIKGKPRHWVITGEGWEALHQAANMQVVTK